MVINFLTGLFSVENSDSELLDELEDEIDEEEDDEDSSSSEVYSDVFVFSSDGFLRVGIFLFDI